MKLSKLACLLLAVFMCSVVATYAHEGMEVGMDFPSGKLEQETVKKLTVKVKLLSLANQMKFLLELMFLLLEQLTVLPLTWTVITL